MISFQVFTVIFTSSIYVLCYNLSSVGAFQVRSGRDVSFNNNAMNLEQSIRSADGCEREPTLPSTRRTILQGAGVTMSALLGEIIMGQPAGATYSAYARREEDWKQREKNGGELVRRPNLVQFIFLI